MENNEEISEIISILYQDDEIVVVNKPAGWLVHRSWLDRHEHKILMLRIRDQIGQHVFPVHRLDKPTSGVMVMGLNPQVAMHLSQQFEHHEVQKTYHALVRGFVFGTEVIDYPLKVITDKIADKFSTEDKEPQSAITTYASLHQYEVPIPHAQHPSTRYSLVELAPKTGRKHQLRRHMTHIRHPIIGDSAHGDLKQNRAFNAYFELKRLMLHASAIQFTHPKNGQKVQFEAPYAQEKDWSKLLHNLENFRFRD